jgi:hypothetical protein
MYLVKQCKRGKTDWTMMGKKSLQDLLSVKSATIVHNDRRQEWLYSRFIDTPLINNAFHKYYDIGFAAPDTEFTFNLWKGYAFPVLAPDVPLKMDLLQKYLWHLEHIICNHNPEHYRTLLLKDAWMFQNPNSHTEYAVVLMGSQGAGKNRYSDMMCWLWGEDWSKANINSLEQITGDTHRDVIAFKKMIVSNELESLESGRGKAAVANFEVLKSRITDDSYTVRNIYEKESTIPNVNNYIFCTNNWNSIRMGVKDRRYFVLEVSEENTTDYDYFTELCASFTEEMKTHLLNFYLRLNTAGFDHRHPPRTELKDEIIESQLSPAENWIQQFEFPEQGCFSLEQMWGKYLNWCDLNQIEREEVGKMLGFAKKISKHCYVEKVGRKKTYSSLASHTGMTTSPAEMKALTEMRKVKREVEADIKRRLGQE